jgi:hypothetical protein
MLFTEVNVFRLFDLLQIISLLKFSVPDAIAAALL